MPSLALERTNKCSQNEFKNAAHVQSMNKKNSNQKETNQGSVLQSLIFPVYEDLQILEKRINNYLTCNTESALKIKDYLFSNMGKKVRPTLFYLTAKLNHYNGDHLHPMAAVCEFVHCASLLHDDVVDNSPIRRNKPTVSKQWGDESAVLMGDLVYATASRLMADTGKIELVRRFAEAISLMSEGELLQLENIYNLEINKETYFTILRGKTAVLMGAACEAPLILADRETKLCNDMNRYGSLLGMSFQLIDDALDYAGESSLTGKSHLKDLDEGKVTYPLILLRERVTETEKMWLNNLWEKHQNLALDTQDKVGLLSLIKKYRCSQDTLQLARQYTEEALEILHQAYPCTQERNSLEAFAAGLLSRIH